MSLHLEGVPVASAELAEGNGGGGSEGVVAGVRLHVLELDSCEQVEAGVLGVGVPLLKLDCK